MENVKQKYKHVIDWFEECSMEFKILEHLIDGEKLYSITISGRVIYDFIDRTKLVRVMTRFEEMKSNGCRVII